MLILFQISKPSLTNKLLKGEPNNPHYALSVSYGKFYPKLEGENLLMYLFAIEEKIFWLYFDELHNLEIQSVNSNDNPFCFTASKTISAYFNKHPYCFTTISLSIFEGTIRFPRKRCYGTS